MENSKMKKLIINTITAIAFIATIFMLPSCGSSGSKKVVSEETKTDTTKKETDVAEVTPEQMKAVGIEIGSIEQQNLTSVVKASGQLTVPPQNKAVVNALVGGVIRRINVIEGQQVSKGQVVVVIENPDFIRLQQDYLTSKDNIVYLAQEYERQRVLKEADAGIGKVYQQASANYAAEKSKLLTLEKQLRQIHINPSQVRKGNLITQVPVTAPISGTVGKITLSVGTFTDASSPIMEIVNNSIIYCDLQVFEKDIAKVRTGQTVNSTLTNQKDKHVSGRVTGINKSFEAANKSVIVHAVLNNVAPLNLIAGMYVSGLIETGKQLVSAVPKDAIVKANDKTYIFIYLGSEQEPLKKNADDKTDEDDKTDTKKEFQQKERFKMVEVVTGVEELDYVEIKLLEELKPNTKIVTKGAFYLFSSMQSIETDDI
jgi:cobalt-zinc-cadmium efflux system membrane fusion protein